MVAKHLGKVGPVTWAETLARIAHTAPEGMEALHAHMCTHKHCQTIEIFVAVEMMIHSEILGEHNSTSEVDGWMG